MKIYLLTALVVLLWGGTARAGETVLFWDGAKTRKRAEGLVSSGGKRIGHWIYWYPNGRKEREGEYTHGRETGTWTYYRATGAKRMEGGFIGGQREGLWTYWSADGKKLMEVGFKDGEEHGLQTVYNPDGAIWGKVEFQNGIRCGYYMLKDGNLIKVAEDELADQ